MLHRSHRISSARFDEVMKKGTVTHSPLFLVRALAVGDDASVRVAAVAPVRVAKTAVARNRMRRRIYEAVTPMVGDMRQGLSICIFAKTPALDADPAALRASIRDVFVKAGLLR